VAQLHTNNPSKTNNASLFIEPLIAKCAVAKKIAFKINRRNKRSTPEIRT